MRNKGAERVVPGVWFLGAVAAMLVVNRTVPGVRLLRAPYCYGGTVLVVAGLATGVWAVRLFRRIGTTVRPFRTPATLVVVGPFRFTRHPMYLGLTIALCGTATLLGGLSPWGIALAFFLLVARPAALTEERLMEETYGDEYGQYARRVRRWL